MFQKTIFLKLNDDFLKLNVNCINCIFERINNFSKDFTFLLFWVAISCIISE